MDYQCAGLVVQIVAAAATWAAVAASLYQLYRERKWRLRQERLSIANQVAAWYEEIKMDPAPNDCQSVYRSVVIHNGGDAPIYDVILTCVGYFGTGPSFKGEEEPLNCKNRSLLSQVNPGSWGVWLPTDGGGMSVITTVEIAFRDTRGLSWVRRGSGLIEALPESPLDYYRISLPPQWTHPVRV